MAERVTKQELERTINIINGHYLKDEKIELSGRYGYFAIDTNRGSNLTTGKTKKEIGIYLDGFLDIISLTKK